MQNTDTAHPAQSIYDGLDDWEKVNARNWCMGAHLTALAAFTGLPFGNIAGPLIVWLIKRNEIPLVDEHGKRAINFQITLTIPAFIVIGICIFTIIYGASTDQPVFFMGGFIANAILTTLIGLYGLVMMCMAAYKVHKGEDFQYFPSIRFLS